MVGSIQQQLGPWPMNWTCNMFQILTMLQELQTILL